MQRARKPKTNVCGASWKHCAAGSPEILDEAERLSAWILPACDDKIIPWEEGPFSFPKETNVCDLSFDFSA
jgi:hypothetical protein